MTISHTPPPLPPPPITLQMQINTLNVYKYMYSSLLTFVSINNTSDRIKNLQLIHTSTGRHQKTGNIHGAECWFDQTLISCDLQPSGGSTCLGEYTKFHRRVFLDGRNKCMHPWGILIKFIQGPIHYLLLALLTACIRGLTSALCMHLTGAGIRVDV